jgi:hypothetical protein
MQQHAKIAPGHAKFTAHAIFFPLLEIEGFEDPAILRCQFSYQGPDPVLILRGYQVPFRIGPQVCGFRGMFVKLDYTASLPEVLQQDIGADRVDIRSQALWLLEAFALAESSQHAEKHLLPEFLYLLPAP